MWFTLRRKNYSSEAWDLLFGPYLMVEGPSKGTNPRYKEVMSLYTLLTCIASPKNRWSEELFCWILLRTSARLGDSHLYRIALPSLVILEGGTKIMPVEEIQRALSLVGILKHSCAGEFLRHMREAKVALGSARPVP